jgi:rhodanese-related sulfurtransferase
MRELSATEAAALLQTAPETTLLLDVREHPEIAAAAVAGALHIPMGEIPARLDEIDRSKTVICLCHLGGRSAQVGVFLEAQGYADVINLAGGTEAWSTSVDTSVPRY